MDGEQNDYTIAVENLKEVLRAQKITYRELAEGIGMSESGVKKILSSSDGSFRRLSQMCRFVGTSISELLDGGTSEILDFSFAEEAQDFFVQNPEAFAFYWRLVYERLSLESAERETKLTEKESFRLLRQLDKFGLLALLPGGRVRVPAVRQIRWVGTGPLVRKLYREWGTRFIQTIAKPDLDETKLFMIRYFKVFPKTYRDLLKAQRDLEAEFVRRAIQDMRTQSPALQHVRWIAGIDDESFLK